MNIPGFADGSVFDLTMKVTGDSDVSEEARRNRQTVIRAYEAQLKGDFDSWWAIFDPDVEFREAESLPYACSVKGLEAAKKGVAGMFSAWSRLELTCEEFATAGDLVICYLQLKATSRKTKQVYDCPGTELFRFRNGKVVDWKAIYWDTHLVRKICGMD